MQSRMRNLFLKLFVSLFQFFGFSKSMLKNSVYQFWKSCLKHYIISFDLSYNKKYLFVSHTGVKGKQKVVFIILDIRNKKMPTNELLDYEYRLFHCLRYDSRLRGWDKIINSNFQML